MKHFIVENTRSGHHIVHTKSGQRITDTPFDDAFAAETAANHMHEQESRYMRGESVIGHKSMDKMPEYKGVANKGKGGSERGKDE